jgi:hypothetical protein
VQLAHHPADLTERLAEVHLRMARRVCQRHEHLPRPPLLLTDIVGDNGDAAGEAVLITQPLENPLRRVPLLPDPSLILFENLVDDRDERIQLRPRRWALSPIPRRHRMLQNLGNRLAIDPKMTRHRPLTHPVNMARSAHPPVKLHRIHLPALSSFASGVKVAEFYSATVRLSDRFRGSVSLRDSQTVTHASQR